MKIENDSNVRYEQEPPAGVVVMLEGNWEGYEVFEDDLSNPELAAVVVEYVERVDGYYPLLTESDNVMGDDIGLVLNAEQEQAVQLAIAGGSVTVEVLTSFGIDATEVWSIQTYTSSGQTPAGERCFTLTAITEEREIILRDPVEDGDDPVGEMLAHSDSGGGDILITFPIEQQVLADETPPLFDIVIEDGQVQEIESMAKTQYVSTPAMNAEVMPVDDEAQLAPVAIEQVTLDPLPRTQVAADIMPPEPENASFDENENEAPIDTNELPIVEDSEIREVEPEETIVVIEQLEKYLSVEEAMLVIDPETEAAPSPNILDIKKSEVAAIIRTTVEYDLVANEDVSLSQEAETEQSQVIDRDIQQPQAIMNEERVADRHLEQSQIVIPNTESAVTELEALPSTEQAIIVDETIRYELPVTDAEYAAGPTDMRQEYSYVVSGEVEHQTFRTAIDKHSGHQSDTKTEHMSEVSTWEVSGFEPTYNFFSASGLATPAEDDIVIPFQTTIRTKRPSEARRTRSRVV